LNREITNLAVIIDDLRKQYMVIQAQYKFQLEQLIKLNDDLRSDMKQIELKNDSLKQENLRVKAENKQFYGEQSILMKELDQQYNSGGNLTQEELHRQVSTLRQELVRLMISNQALNKQHLQSLDKIKQLQRVANEIERNSNSQDQMAIRLSLESELEREKKVRMEAEADRQEFKQQLIVIKEKGQQLVESLKAQIEQNEFEIKRFREENQELANQVQSLKQESKNSLSVQEDLVRLIQSLQIELNQTRSSSGASGEERPSFIEVRCQHEDDFTECAQCRVKFSVVKRKHRCNHCCKIFCAECCTKTVNSGPNLRPHKVCETCHTLLDKDSAHSTKT
jgi:hypothetical protein